MKTDYIFGDPIQIYSRMTNQELRDLYGCLKKEPTTLTRFHLLPPSSARKRKGVSSLSKALKMAVS